MLNEPFAECWVINEKILYPEGYVFNTNSTLTIGHPKYFEMPVCIPLSVRRNFNVILGLQPMKLWSSDLSTMECNFGSSMMLTFSFLRWVFFLNFVLSWFWMALVVFPFFHQPPKYFSWTTFQGAFARSRLANALQVCVHLSPSFSILKFSYCTQL